MRRLEFYARLLCLCLWLGLNEAEDLAPAPSWRKRYNDAKQESKREDSVGYHQQESFRVSVDRGTPGNLDGRLEGRFVRRNHEGKQYESSSGTLNRRENPQEMISEKVSNKYVNSERTQGRRKDSKNQKSSDGEEEDGRTLQHGLLRLRENGYEGLTIAIGKEVPEGDCNGVVRNLQVCAISFTIFPSIWNQRLSRDYRCVTLFTNFPSICNQRDCNGVVRGLQVCGCIYYFPIDMEPKGLQQRCRGVAGEFG